MEPIFVEQQNLITMRLSSVPHLLLLVFLTLACNEQGTNQRNNKAFQEELKSRELKRATAAEISNAAYQQGARIADVAESLISESLRSNDSTMALLVHYKDAILAISDSLTQKEDIQVQRIASLYNAPNTMEGMILDAYLYNIEQGLRVEDNIQVVEDEYFLYTRPILLSENTCLRCHGEVGKDLLEADEIYLKNKHPDIQMGHKQGDFMGMWSIRLSRKIVIRAL